MVTVWVGVRSVDGYYGRRERLDLLFAGLEMGWVGGRKAWGVVRGQLYLSGGEAGRYAAQVGAGLQPPPSGPCKSPSGPWDWGIAAVAKQVLALDAVCPSTWPGLCCRVSTAAARFLCNCRFHPRCNVDLVDGWLPRVERRCELLCNAH
jgi:hypothetical protein